MLVLTLRTHDIMILGGMKGKLSSKIPSANESRARKEKMMKWVFQILTIDCNWIIYVMHLLMLKTLASHFTNPLVNVALKFYAVN